MPRRPSKTVPRETFEQTARERDLLHKALLDAVTQRFNPVAVETVVHEGLRHTFAFYRPLAPDSGYVLHWTRTARVGANRDVTQATDGGAGVSVQTFDDWVAAYERFRPHCETEKVKDKAVAAFRVAQQKAFDQEREERSQFLRGAIAGTE